MLLRRAAITVLFTATVAAAAYESEQPLAQSQPQVSSSERSQPSAAVGTGGRSAPDLPPPSDTSQVAKFPVVVGWPEGRTPRAPDGFTVSKYASEFEYPRWFYVLPNGDVLISEARSRVRSDYGPEQRRARLAARFVGDSPNRITLLRDADRDGTPEVRETFLSGLNQPFGMALLGNTFYVANTDALVRYPYQQGQTRISSQGEKILDLPADGYNSHWVRNVVAAPDGSKLYVSVGSGTNVDVERTDEKDPRRAAILEVNPDGSEMRIYASGLRNPIGIDWQPESGAMWTAVNERDGIGDDLVPDYLTSVREGAFYGWPYSYFGQNEDPRKRGERPDLVARAVVPDLPLGSHTASIGLLFYRGTALPERYRGGAFVAQHGSWNRTAFSGYKVVFVPFRDGRPSGPVEGFLTGFIANEASSEVYGRPTGVAALPDGSLLVADDAGQTIWRVSPASQATDK
jgi:glucose/arabinose dehydrogenase